MGRNYLYIPNLNGCAVRGVGVGVGVGVGARGVGVGVGVGVDKQLHYTLNGHVIVYPCWD